MEELLKQALSHIPQFIGRLTNLIIAPIKTAREGFIFCRDDFVGALVFFGICLLVAQVLKVPMLPSTIPVVPHLAADAVWKMVVVLIEALIIAGVMRLLKGRYALGDYIVANCYYFGVLSVLSHLILLSGNQLLNTGIVGNNIYILYHIVGFAAVTFWMLVAWRTYGEFNQFGWDRTVAALVLVVIISIPALFFAKLLRNALVPTLYPFWGY